MKSILLILFLFVSSSNAGTYFVDKNGSNSNKGEIDAPWKTIKYGITQLSDYDTLYIREGIYYEEYLALKYLKGVFVSAYQNENVEITGGISDFREPDKDKWEMSDASINLYRSKDTYNAEYMNAWLLDNDLHILQYEIMDNLISTNYGPVNGFSPMYQGPGILLHSDGHLYIRLENNPNDLIDPLGNQMEPIPSDLNPNHHSISVSFAKRILIFGKNANNITFKNLIFSHAEYIVYGSNRSSGNVFDGCKIFYGRYGFVLEYAGIKNYEIKNCEFSNSTPQYVYWCDVKNRDKEVHEAYPEFQSAAITGRIPGFNIHHNIFRDGFDALYISGGSENVKITDNQFYNLRDDAMTFGLVGNVEVAYNIMWKVGEGVSCDFKLDENSTVGDLYVHNNIIDASHYQHGGRDGNFRGSTWATWMIIDAFGSHGDYYPAAWKIYNNTIISRRSGYAYNPAELPKKVEGGPELYIYNNIFFVLDDRIVFRNHQASSGAHYNGNVMYRLLDSTYHESNINRYPLYYKFGNNTNYSTLEDFRVNSGANWEINGMEVDPLLDVESIVNDGFEGDKTWKRYFPMADTVFTEGASYTELNWPGVEGINYRGAMGDSTVTVIEDKIVNNNFPLKFSLEQNYPNPFNPTSTIRFSLPESGLTKLVVYNITGSEISTILNREISSGVHEIKFDGSSLSSGVYFYRLKSGRFSAIMKMIILK